jgi:hypothetical protein
MAILLGLATVAAIVVVFGIVALVALTGHDLGVTVVVAIVLGVALAVGEVLFWVRVRALAVPALMLEPVGVGGALGRAVRLSAAQFWRLLGILLLVGIIVGFAGAMLRLPFNVAASASVSGSDLTGASLFWYVLFTAVGTVISAAVLQPYQAAVSTLLYVDQRIRKEAYDVELLGRAGILGG